MKLRPGAAVRIHVSTVLAAVALLGFPIAVRWIPAPRLFERERTAAVVYSWALYDLPALLFVVAFLAALVTVLWLAIRRRWQGVPQLLLEMLICVACVFFLQTYY